MAQKEGGTVQGRVKTEDSLGAKIMVGAPSAGGGVVVEVREKKGPLRAAIPTMPFPVAVICLFLNTFIPGLGEFKIPLSLLPLSVSDVTREKPKAKVFGHHCLPLKLLNKWGHACDVVVYVWHKSYTYSQCG